MKNSNRLTVLVMLTGFFISCQAQKNRKQAGTEQNPEQKLNSKEIKLLIDSLSNALDRLYIYPDKAILMSKSIKQKLKNGDYNKIGSRQEVGFQLHNDLQQAHRDGHLGLRYNPQLAAYLSKPMSDDEKLQQRVQDLNAARESNFAFKKTELLFGNIGYIRWDEFVGCVEEAQPTLNAAFQFVSNCKALIIDMRYNGGGSPEMVLRTQNYFFNQKTHMNDIINRSNDTLKRYTDPAKTDFKLNMPVYILTSRLTFSGAEDFTYGLKHAKRATIVGETTGGGAHPTGSYDMGQGFVANIPIARAPVEADWEGIGVLPDVSIPSEQAFTKARILISTELLSRAKDEREKNMFQWNLNNIRSETTKMPDSVVLNSYTGVYEGGLDFHIKDNQLFCMNAERGNVLFELRYIDSNLFVLDENVQVQFEKDATGTYTHLKMLWKNGAVTEKLKM
ncbi:S41 family peptidase [Flavobacterium ranwuense]|nr:S41 family peptidase [Flavobacterium ranwuense]